MRLLRRIVVGDEIFIFCAAWSLDKLLLVFETVENRTAVLVRGCVDICMQCLVEMELRGIAVKVGVVLMRVFGHKEDFSLLCHLFIEHVARSLPPFDF